MTRRQTDPLRPLTSDERDWLVWIARSQAEAVSRVVSRFNREGIAAIEPRHGGGPPIVYAEAERGRILSEARRKPR